MTDDELLALIAEGEGPRVEFKRNAAKPDVLRQNICAMSNDLPGSGRPGVIFVGLEDDGTCAGLDVTTQLLDQLHQLRLDGKIQPVPSMTVERRTLDVCTVAAIIVHPTELPPARSGGRIWVRSSSGLTVATRDEERRIASRQHGRTPHRHRHPRSRSRSDPFRAWCVSLVHAGRRHPTAATSVGLASRATAMQRSRTP